MDRDEIRRIAAEVVSEILELDADELRNDADFHTDLGGDSIQRLELIVTLEKRFGVHYSPGDERAMNCVNDIVTITEKYAARRV